MINPEDYLDYVKTIVRSKFKNSRELDDLISIGNVALLNAIDEYKSDKGASFKTYLNNRVKWTIIEYLRTNVGMYSKAAKRRVVEHNNNFRDIEDSPEPCLYISKNEHALDIEALKNRIRTKAKLSKIAIPLREIEIFIDVYVNKLKWQQVADKYSITKSRVSQILHDSRMKDYILLAIEDTAPV